MEEKIYKYYDTEQIEVYNERSNRHEEPDYSEKKEDLAEKFFKDISADYANSLNDLFDGETIINIKYDYKFNWGMIGITVTSKRELTESELDILNEAIEDLNCDEINCMIDDADFASSNTGLSLCNIDMCLQ